MLVSCEQTVVVPVAVDEVEVLPPSITVVAGDEQTAAAVLRADGGSEVSGLSVSWSVDNPNVATVSSQGVIAGLRPGLTWVRASAEGVTGSAEVTVLPGPRIGLSTRIVDVDADRNDDPVTAEVDVVNDGNGTLDALGLEVRGANGGAVVWLEASLGATTAPTKLRLVVDARDMLPGLYEAFVVLSSPVATTGPNDVRVRLRVPFISILGG